MTQSDLTKNDIKQILSSYSVDEYKNHWPLQSGPKRTIYIIKTSGGKYVIKVFEKYDPDNLLFTISVQEFAINNNLPIPRIEQTKNGEPLSEYRGKGIVIQKFHDGRHPKRYSDCLLKNMASTFAKLNKTLMQYPLAEKSAWRVDHQFLSDHLATKAFDFNIKKEQEKLINEMPNIVRCKLRRSLIHGDLNSNNFLVNKKKITAIIDWEKCREDYIAYDIAVFLIEIIHQSKGRLQNHVKLYLQEYEKYLQLNNEERKAIYYFIKMHMLVIMNWLKKQLKKQPHREILIKKEAQQTIAKYFCFNKLTLEQFINFL